MITFQKQFHELWMVIRMIKLAKMRKPDVLTQNAQTWTDEYCSCLTQGVKPLNEVSRRYNHHTIKDALIDETSGKCAYCESKMKHISYGDIEHILPKNANARPDLYVEWTNLTLACEVCNRTNKKDYYSEEHPLINPYRDEPNNYFLFLGPLVSAKQSEDRAVITESTLKLNRSELVEKRQERIKSINSLLYSWTNARSPEIKKVLEEQLHLEYAKDKEYSATVKSFLDSHGFKTR